MVIIIYTHVHPSTYMYNVGESTNSNISNNENCNWLAEYHGFLHTTYIRSSKNKTIIFA